MNGKSSHRQGGDPRGRSSQLDLSTCVNPYGPPDAVLAALRRMPASAVRAHPFGAAHEVESAYAEYTSRPVTEFVAGRGTSDLIWSLAQQLDGKKVGLPMPAYTEFRQAFPHARPFGGGPSTHPVEVLDEAMQACDAVIVSNPHNPTGQFLQRNELAGVASRHPDSVLVVDESYIDFLADDAAAVTLVGCAADNVIVLRSPSKFFGLAGVRSGVAWSLHPQRTRWESRRTNWPVSAFAAQALRIALAERVWAAEVRQELRSDAAWLDSCLSQWGLDIAPGRLHFRLLTGSGTHVARFAHTLGTAGVAVRVLEEEYGVGSPAVRISAPHRRDRWRLAAALGGPQLERALCPIAGRAHPQAGLPGATYILRGRPAGHGPSRVCASRSAVPGSPAGSGIQGRCRSSCPMAAALTVPPAPPTSRPALPTHCMAHRTAPRLPAGIARLTGSVPVTTCFSASNCWHSRTSRP